MGLKIGMLLLGILPKTSAERSINWKKNPKRFLLGNKLS